MLLANSPPPGGPGPVHSLRSLLRDLATCTLYAMTTLKLYPACHTNLIQAQAFILLDIDPTRL